MLVFSTHSLEAFPETGLPERRGEGAGEGFNINVPLPPGAGDSDIVAAFEDRLVPAAESFRPDLVLVSAGFDARTGDPVGTFTVSDAGFARLTQIVMRIAADHSPFGVISLLEGGFDPKGLASAVLAHMRALLEQAA